MAEAAAPELLQFRDEGKSEETKKACYNKQSGAWFRSIDPLSKKKVSEGVCSATPDFCPTVIGISLVPPNKQRGAPGKHRLKEINVPRR